MRISSPESSARSTEPPLKPSTMAPIARNSVTIAIGAANSANAVRETVAPTTRKTEWTRVARRS
ncbi:hypothetical protein [Nonomuraea africana]|uniref:hypothetical protein n=1 Tax=Nonomuraea africana TaxID=46171 RepID=UPI00340ADDF0